MDLIDKSIVLVLNKNWQAIDICTVREALTQMNSGIGSNQAAVAINVDYHQNDEGVWNFEEANLVPTPFHVWMHLPIREFDEFIRTPKLMIRVPTVVMAVNYGKIPKKQKRAANANIRDRDKSICQVTGKLLSKTEGNVDHWVPKSKGGKDTWENKVWMSKEINSLKGDKMPNEVGLKLIKPPKAPLPIPFLVKEIKHRDWKFFV